MMQSCDSPPPSNLIGGLTLKPNNDTCVSTLTVSLLIFSVDRLAEGIGMKPRGVGVAVGKEMQKEE